MAQDSSRISSRAYVIYVSVVAAIGGLLFGFDTAIVAGATRYMKEQFSLNSLQEGWAVSIVLIGCMFGAGFSGSISDRIGRRRFMLVSAILFFISGIGCALPKTIGEFIDLSFRRRAGHRFGLHPRASLYL